LTYSSTLLPQTNEPAEIQKAILDLLSKINEQAKSIEYSASATASQISSVQVLDTVVYFSGTLEIPPNASNGLYIMQGEASSLVITLPPRPTSILGAKYTFKKASSNAHTLTISAQTGDTIGSTTSTSFVLPSQDDFVTLENDGRSWSVLSTSGPISIVTQASGATVAASGGWPDIGVAAGLSIDLPAGEWIIQSYFNSRIVGPAVSAFALTAAGSVVANPMLSATGIGSAIYAIVPVVLQSKLLLASPATISIACKAGGGSGEIAFNSGWYQGETFAQRIA
jgi:hypothetical protein